MEEMWLGNPTQGSGQRPTATQKRHLAPLQLTTGDRDNYSVER